MKTVFNNIFEQEIGIQDSQYKICSTTQTKNNKLNLIKTNYTFISKIL